MTPSEQAKAQGLRSLAEVVRLSGVSYQTLTNWHRDKPELFEVVLLGCEAKKVLAREPAIQ
jgi:AcrR family transcriptional regulator